MDVAEAVGRSLAANGVDHVFGVVGSGNFHVTNALIAAGARFVAAAHEGGAACMADAYARVSGRLSVLSVHQGPGVTNALTGITEAAKSRTPMIVLAPEATQPASNFFVDLDAIAAGVGAVIHRVRAERAAEDAADACQDAMAGPGRTVVLALPLDIQASPASPPRRPRRKVQPPVPLPDIGGLMDALAHARRPVFIAGRGATRQPAAAREALARLADRCGALLAVSAGARGLFAGNPWYLDVSGGFATPLAAELISQADLVVAWGSTLNMWTTRHGRLLAPDATVAQVDLDPAALGRNRSVDIALHGDLVGVALACAEEWDRRVVGRQRVSIAASAGERGPGRATSRPPATSAATWCTPELAARIAAEGRWRDVPYVDESDAARIDPRTVTIALDDLLPEQRTVVIDSGNFMGYPSMFLAVPDSAGFVFTQSFQSVGLGLASALGAAVARPDRLTVAALGDGGFLMSIAELTTAVRLGLPLLILVYNDAAYGAEVHHFGPAGHPLDTVRFPDADLAATARGFGCTGMTVRAPADIAEVATWLAGPRSTPLVVDAKVAATRGSWWLADAFRGH